ncbi:septum site-determining protein MinC [Thiomicrospira pelophila]|uniref:septum site-determining protein MinC n=1 Tax=Thiomicrospira pelophila TaxID=934 RepID=UPI0004A77BD2|nr:septum site-determining protein MinC [Thiomicrospira pelophila]
MSKAVALKGSVLSLSVLKVYSDDIALVKSQLEQSITQAPDFFNGLPVVIEPEADGFEPTFLALLVDFLHQHQMVPIGVRTSQAAIREQAQYAGLAVFEPVANAADEAPKSSSANSSADQGALVVEGAIRSGRQVYAQGRDLIVKGTVNPGAEVVADGHVHIYGSVKGKVFAGSAGYTQARIYAHNLDAEMVCIAGMYQMSEDIKPEYKQGWIEVSLHGDRLVFNKLA